ncbi:hypothetical protein BH20VER3_BH20VER3_14090 [soil metagenome]
MSTVQEIEAAISKLAPADVWTLKARLDDLCNDLWDAQIAEDAQPGGPLDRLAEEALREIEAGETQALDDFLRHP